LSLLVGVAVASPAFAGAGPVLATPRGSIALVFHVVMNGVVLYKIWSHKTDSRFWQVAWSAVSLLAFVVGPILFLGLAAMPGETPRGERFRDGIGGGNVTGTNFSMGFGSAGAEGIPEIARVINGELEPGEEAPHSRMAAEARQLAKTGDTKAQAHYAMLLEYGDGTAQDYKGAARWYRRAANQGFAEAQAHLSNLYDKGLGVEQSGEEALFWICLASLADKHYAARREELAAKTSAEAAAAVAKRISEWVRKEETPPAPV
jgi:hypothetical protein